MDDPRIAALVAEMTLHAIRIDEIIQQIEYIRHNDGTLEGDHEQETQEGQEGQNSST